MSIGQTEIEKITACCETITQTLAAENNFPLTQEQGHDLYLRAQAREAIYHLFEKRLRAAYFCFTTKEKKAAFAVKTSTDDDSTLNFSVEAPTDTPTATADEEDIQTAYYRLAYQYRAIILALTGEPTLENPLNQLHRFSELLTKSRLLPAIQFLDDVSGTFNSSIVPYKNDSLTRNMRKLFYDAKI